MKITSAVLNTWLRSDFGDIPSFLCSDFSLNLAKRVWLAASLTKKFVGPSEVTPAQRREKAIALFREMNQRCATAFVQPDGSTYIGDTLWNVRDSLYHQLNSFETGPLLKLQDAVANGRMGPGKSAGVEGTDFLHKMGEGRLTCTNEKLYAYYTVYTDARWRSMECERVKLSGLPVQVKSELFTVPKSTEIDRVANKEPSLEMYFQLGLGKSLEKVLRKEHNISLDSQPRVNRRLAQIGSVTGKYATIDLTSASDTIAYSLVKWLIDPANFSALDQTRSKSTMIDGEELPLFMISTMGNGFTFPLQTLIFATIVRTIYRDLDIPFWDTEEAVPAYSVFGDDIVVDRRAYHRVCHALEACGFIVNSGKSYVEGPFRESCGHDYFRGHNIRGIYIRKLSNDADSFSAFNRLTRWSVRNGITIANLLRGVKGLGPFSPVPFDTGDSAGHHWPRQLVENRKVGPNGAEYYRALRPIPGSREVKRDLGYGPLVAALGGYLTSRDDRRRISYHVGIPTKNPRYKVMRETTHSWDWIPHAGLTIRDYILTVAML